MNRLRDLKILIREEKDDKDLDEEIQLKENQNTQSISYIPYSISRFGKEIMKKRTRVNISANTIHQYKGQEADVVIILNVIDKIMPFTRQGKGDALFNRTLLDILEEERHLFYVALTRARQQVYLLTVNEEQSDYISNIYDMITQ